MTRSTYARRIRAVVLAGPLTLLALLAPTAGSAATPGTWGVQQATYVDGMVCSNGSVTSPLAAWNFGDTGLDFLLDPVTSSGFTDSALLPQPGSPGRLVTPVSPGQYGMGSAADVATYAALISVFGTGPDPDAAEVARAILDNAGAGAVPNCVSAAAAQSLVTEAARLAGPYTVTAAPATSPAAAGGAGVLNVRVTNSFGQPVPGAAVAASSPVPIFAGGAATAAAATDATGTAHVPFTVPQDNTLASVPITATAAVSVGLEAVTAGGVFGQRYASAVYADPPVDYSANVTLPISQGAAPVLTSGLGSTAITQGTALALSEQLTGMFGHTGHVTFTITGPLKLDPTTLCMKITAASFAANTPTAATSNLDVIGDSVITGGNWQPTTIGCYLLKTVIATTNATPPATAAAKPAVLTVLDTKAAATPAHIVFGPGGAVSETVQVTHSYQRPGTLSTRILGPITPGNGDCRGADWSKVKPATIAPTNTTGDGNFTIATGALPKVGCYQLQTALVLAIAPHLTARVPLTSSAVNGVFYVLQPTVTAAAQATSVVSPASVHVAVTVLNTFGLAGQVRVRMLHTVADQFGCRQADFSHATVVATGAPVPTSGDGTVTATSAATSALGCYALVPTLVMDANSTVTATGTPTSDNVVLAGVGLAPPAARVPPRVSRSLLGMYVALAVFLLLLMVTAFTVFRYVTQTYRNDGDDEDDGRPSPLGSRLASLFTPPTGSSGSSP
jgi:hypothetical protein